MKNLYPGINSSRFSFTGENLKLNAHLSNHFSLKKSYYIVLVIAAGFFTTSSYAQVGINTFTSTSNTAISTSTNTGPGCGVSAQSEYIPSNNNRFNYNFGSNSGSGSGVRAVNGYMAGGKAYSVIANVVTGVVMRRVNNAGTGGTKDILFFAGSRNPGLNTTGQTNSTLTLNLNAGYVASMDVAFAQNNLLIGTDNIFSNQGNANDNNNNIERVDVMIGAGYTIIDAQKYGFPILERGVYGAHDAFKIAVILAIDASGNPIAYSNVVSVTSTNYNNTSSSNPVADGTYNYFLFRRTGSSSLKVNQHITDQGIGGVAFRFSDFGIASGTKIYGYSIMANDFNSTSGADVVNYNNAARFPENTSESVGGLDILAVLGIAMQTIILPVEMSSFTAVKKANHAGLDWTTVNEMNNRGFRIERSTDGKNWIQIGLVQSKSAQETSTEKINYSFNDNTPAKGINYYRLVQLDFDGKEKVSEIKTVSFGKDDANPIKVFPNPVVSDLHVEGLTSGMNIKLVDARGAVLSQFTAGTSTAEVIATDKLNKGVYFVQVGGIDGTAKTLRFVKM
jgi:hypothetical protein